MVAHLAERAAHQRVIIHPLGEQLLLSLSGERTEPQLGEVTVGPLVANAPGRHEHRAGACLRRYGPHHGMRHRRFGVLVEPVEQEHRPTCRHRLPQRGAAS